MADSPLVHHQGDLTLLEALGEAALAALRAAQPEAEKLDRERYQTIYAAHCSAIAAPTARFHFTPKLFDRLRAKASTTRC